MVAHKDCCVKGTINVVTDLHGYTLPRGLRHFSLYFNPLALFCYDLAGEVEFSQAPPNKRTSECQEIGGFTSALSSPAHASLPVTLTFLPSTTSLPSL